MLEIAEAIEVAEGRIRDLIASGMRLDEARKQEGYHRLQRREEG